MHGLTYAERYTGPLKPFGGRAHGHHFPILSIFCEIVIEGLGLRAPVTPPWIKLKHRFQPRFWAIIARSDRIRAFAGTLAPTKARTGYLCKYARHGPQNG